jgi:UPF0716 family protein affecting phage T7 exclusion
MVAVGFGDAVYTVANDALEDWLTPVLITIVVLLLVPAEFKDMAELLMLLPPVDKGIEVELKFDVAVAVAMLKKAGNFPAGLTPRTIPLWQWLTLTV